MPQDIYIDGINAEEYARKAEQQAQQSQPSPSTTSTVVVQEDEDELPGWGQHYLNDPAIRALRKRYGSEAYVKDLEARSSQPSEEKGSFLPSNVLIKRLGLKGSGLGRAAARGIVRGLFGLVDYPFAIYNFAKQGWHTRPTFKPVESYKIAAKTLTQPEVATEVGIAMATGLAIGYGASKLATKIATMRAQRTVRNMAFERSRMYTPSPEEIMQGSPFQSLRTFKTAGGKWGVTEKGVGMSITAMDKNRGFISVMRYDSGVEFGATAKGFIPSYKAKLLGITEKPFFIQNVGKASGGVPPAYYQQTSIMGTLSFGRTARLTPKAYLAYLYKTEYPFALMSETTKIAPAVHVAEGVGAVTAVSSTLTISKEMEQREQIIAPKVDILSELAEDTSLKQTRGQKLLQVQVQKSKIKPTPIMTYKQSLEQQVWKELKPEQGLESQQEQSPIQWIPGPSPTPQPEPQMQKEQPALTVTTPPSFMPPEQAQKQEQRVTPALTTSPFLLATIKPPSFKPTKIMPPIPFRLRFSPKYGGSSGGLLMTKMWGHKNKWGDIRFSLDSLKRSLNNVKLSLKINPAREKPKPLSKRERKARRLKKKLKKRVKMARVVPKKKKGSRRR
ncbi:MAG: hypothetical protein H0Z18_09180 [Thermococcus sp.]|uniref:hypothetical protein n=1 Tax=Thermococcus sp. TaxID=35749 RepID=UPI001D90EF83|nr:hypothetical protein [Thermococcus sp.]MBO8175416.1 hypothetical protein [Thermococcus sp.]